MKQQQFKKNKIRDHLLISICFTVIVFFFFALLIRSELGKQINHLLIMKKELEKKVFLLEYKAQLLEYESELIRSYRVKKVLATAYNSTRNQTNRDPYITASGMPVCNNTIALSRDLIRAENEIMLKVGYNPKGIFSFGDTINIVYVKPVIIKDTMNRRYKNRADLWTPNYGIARQWGKRQIYLFYTKSISPLFASMDPEKYCHINHGLEISSQ